MLVFALYKQRAEKGSLLTHDLMLYPHILPASSTTSLILNSDTDCWAQKKMAALTVMLPWLSKLSFQQKRDEKSGEELWCVYFLPFLSTVVLIFLHLMSPLTKAETGATKTGGGVNQNGEVNQNGCKSEPIQVQGCSTHEPKQAQEWTKTGGVKQNG